MRVVHVPDGTEDSRELATDIAVADSFFEQFRGLRFRADLPDGFALVFPFGSVGRRDVDMLFVRTPIDVIWVADEEVQRVETLRSWIGFGVARADQLIELPPGRAANVSEGDRVVIEGGTV